MPTAAESIEAWLAAGDVDATLHILGQDITTLEGLPATI